MGFTFPKLPDTEYSWRIIQIEPIAHSEERIALAAIIKFGAEPVQIVEFLKKTDLSRIFGQEFGTRLSDCMDICVHSAKVFYSKIPLAIEWTPPLEGFFVSQAKSSYAETLEEAQDHITVRFSSLSIFWCSKGST